MTSGRWASSNRKAELNAEPDFPARRLAAIRAAGGRCQARLPSGRRCPRPANQGDHVIAGDPRSPIQALCEHHHALKSAQEGVAARRETAKKLRRNRKQPPKHPGALR